MMVERMSAVETNYNIFMRAAYLGFLQKELAHDTKNTVALLSL